MTMEYEKHLDGVQESVQHRGEATKQLGEG